MEKMKKLFDRVLEVSCIALMSVMIHSGHLSGDYPLYFQ